MNEKKADFTRWLLYGFVALVGVGIVLSAVSGRHVPSGEAAPGFTMPRHEGGTVSLTDLKGKVVMLDFWATWCPPCVRELPVLVKLAKELEPQGVVLVAMNQDDPDVAPDVVERFVRDVVPEVGPYVVFDDGSVGAQYRVQSLPTLYLLGRDGEVLQVQEGYAPEAVLRAHLEKALAAPRTP